MRSGASSGRSSNRSCWSATTPTSSSSFRAIGAPTKQGSPTRSALRRCASLAPRKSCVQPASSQAVWRRSRILRSLRYCSTRRSSARARYGSGPVRLTTWRRWRRSICCALLQPGPSSSPRPARIFEPQRRERSVVQETEKIWMNGELVDWGDAKIHIGTHALHYGSGVFEGVRCYDTPRGPAVFRLGDHFRRLHNSAQLLYMQIPYSVDELTDACNDLLAANALPECYIRPIAFYGYGQLGVAARDNPVEVAIMSWPWGAYLGDDALRNGIRAKISSWQRIGANVIPHVSKATGVYINSLLAVTEANNAGYDEAILLTGEGTVADGSGENIFVVRDGVLYTPDLAAGILPGITRNSIIELADDLGYSVVEKALIRSDLYLADEVFMCGTAAEVTPLRSIDDHEIGVGPITRELQKAYHEAVRGGGERYAQWRELVPSITRAG